MAENGITPSVYSFPTVKPIDEETIKKCAESHTIIVTCEENNIMGGFGSAVSEVMADNGLNSKLIRIGNGYSIYGPSYPLPYRKWFLY